VRAVVHEDHSDERLDIPASHFDARRVPLALDQDRPPVPVTAFDVNGEIAGPSDRANPAVSEFTEETRDRFLEPTRAHGHKLAEGPRQHSPAPLGSVPDPDNEDREESADEEGRD
jgi:hypothetical protein